MAMSDYYHTHIIERMEDDKKWYRITYKVSDGFKNTVIMDESSLVSLYHLIGRVIRADHEKEDIWSTTVQGS
jgi:hypothetical protein